MAQKSSRPQQAKANVGVERHIGFSVVAFVIGGVVVVALWCVSGGVAAPAVALRDIGASELVSLPLLLSLRLLCASVALYTLLSVYFNRAGLRMSYQGSTVHISRLRRWTTFTVWCFTALFLYFALAAFCSAMLLAGRGEQIPAAVAQAALILFAVSYPVNFLVTAVMSFVLIPTALRTDFPVTRMFRWRPLIMHNGNVLMMQLAMLIAPPPVSLAHLPYALLFGCAYAIFSWLWFHRTGVFYYFFLDYRRPYAIAAYLGLLAVLTLFYGLGYGLASAARQAENRWWLYPLIGLATLAVTRLWPPLRANEAPSHG